MRTLKLRKYRISILRKGSKGQSRGFQNPCLKNVFFKMAEGESNMDTVPPSPEEFTVEIDLGVDLSGVAATFSDEDTIDYELQNLQEEISGIENNLPEETAVNVESANGSVENTEQNESEGDTSDEDFIPYESDNSDYYEIENEEREPVENIIRLPIVNYDGDHEHEDDFGDGWIWSERDDIGPSVGPFNGKPGMNVTVPPDAKPEFFFNSLFDQSMWATICDETNRYARQTVSSRRKTGDVIEATSQRTFKRFCRFNNWKDVNEGDIKIFVAHLIVIGLVKKPNLERYWSTNRLVETPFFGKYLSRNAFQKLLSTIHLCDNTQIVPQNHPRYDPLFKVRDFMSMLQRNFKFLYKPSKHICIDEACCAYKGRVKFKVRNLTHIFAVMRSF